MLDPRATNEDLTAKARIRNAALDLYAQHGEDRTSLRAVAAEAGVTLGLVQHHFTTKARLRDAVDQLVVDYFHAALRGVPESSDPVAHAEARDAAVRGMLADNPPVMNYVRRALLDPSGVREHLLEVLVRFTRDEVAALRDANLVSTTRRESTQVVAVLVRQMGELFLQPMLDAVWKSAAEDTDAHRPRLRITVED